MEFERGEPRLGENGADTSCGSGCGNHGDLFLQWQAAVAATAKLPKDQALPWRRKPHQFPTG